MTLNFSYIVDELLDWVEISTSEGNDDIHEEESISDEFSNTPRYILVIFSKSKSQRWANTRPYY